MTDFRAHEFNKSFSSIGFKIASQISQNTINSNIFLKNRKQWKSFTSHMILKKKSCWILANKSAKIATAIFATITLLCSKQSLQNSIKTVNQKVLQRKNLYRNVQRLLKWFVYSRKEKTKTLQNFLPISFLPRDTPQG